MALAEAQPRDLARGMLLMAGAVSLFPINDAIAKILTGEGVGVFMVGWGRYVFHFLTIFVILATPGRVGQMRTGRPVAQALRGLSVALSMVCFVSALRHIQLVEAIAILFTGPLFMVALSVPMLREKVGVHRWAAVLVGFAGALIVIRPGFGEVHWAGLYALAAALLVALQHIAARSLGATDRPFTTQFHSALWGLIFFTALLPFFWQPLTLEQWGLMAAMGFVGGLGHLGVIWALSMAPVSLLSPFTYTQIVGATALGYLLFGDLPDGITVLGVAVIIGSGLYVYQRERMHARRSA